MPRPPAELGMEGWLRESGMFGSRVVVLEVGTHDLF
jgi:hypothetical protein